MATNAAKAEGFDLSEYSLGDFGEELSVDKSEWIFEFHLKAAPEPYFLVVVNRFNGQTKVIPGE